MKARQLLRNTLSWMKRHRPHTMIGVGALLIVIAASATYAYLGQPLPTVAVTPPPKPKPAKPTAYYSPLTGLKVKNAAAAKKPVTGVMIENSLESRPQSGLKQSGVVYEAIAEGGITRFLVLYQQEKPQMIGPVRSLRPYDIDWLIPYNASIAHVGGSKAALDEIRNGQHRDIDQFFNAGSYWRTSDRYPPHNMYTSFKKLDALNTSKGYKASEVNGFSRTDAKPAKKPNAKRISMTVSSTYFNPHYTYNAKHNNYKRYQGPDPHRDREKGQIAPAVVIALMVNEKTVIQYGAPREVIKTSGSGKAYIFQNGTVTKATWHKEDKKSQLSFTDKKGKDIPLVRGQTWITAIPNGKGSVSWR